MMARRLLRDDESYRTALAPGMVGKKYGHLTVLGLAGRREYGVVKRYRVRYLRVRCDCGREYEIEAQHLRTGHANRCDGCRRETLAEKERESVRLPSGRTIAQIAAAAGLKADTVYARWRRGWPEADLGLRPDRRPRHEGVGAKRVRPAVTLRTTAVQPDRKAEAGPNPTERGF